MDAGPGISVTGQPVDFLMSECRPWPPRQVPITPPSVLLIAIVADLGRPPASAGSQPGPLGSTLIAVEPGRVRVVSDPGPKQYCVRQGWLMRPGEIAICAPNRVSVQVAGRTKVYDSISY